MFSLSGLIMSSKKSWKPVTTGNNTRKKKRGSLKKTGSSAAKKQPTVCLGVALHLQDRIGNLPNPYSSSCSLRCRHPAHLKERTSSLLGKNDEWIPEDLYKRYTETDSRPVSPDNYSRRSTSVPRALSVSADSRKCKTPEPETKQCQFHHRRVLILDLRRVKSVDAITRQNSFTTATSVDSTYGDDDIDNRSSSAKGSSIFHQFTPRNVSLSRSNTPKTRNKGKKKKAKERSASPVAYERSSSPKILEGKLRRHGRRKKDNEETEDGKAVDSDIEKEKTPEESRKTPTTLGLGPDDPTETQMSAMKQADWPSMNQLYDLDKIDGEANNENSDIQRKMQFLMNPRKPLYDILDEKFSGAPWNPHEMTSLNDDIQAAHEEIKKFETKFKSANIKMKEDLWLSFPRTWSHNSATFGVPHNPRLLQDLGPIEYLIAHVEISQPRKHLYNLVFHRYRTLENPTGKLISMKAVQKAIGEVIGRQMTNTELEELANNYLGVNISSFNVDENIFRGICAFCERIYGNYSLEDCKECHACSNYDNKDKTRCHWKQKSHIEKADFEYIQNKINNGKLNQLLANLLTRLFERN